METVYDALTRFRLFFNAAQTPVLDRCIQMLKCMMDAYSGSHMRLDTDVLKRQITVLGENGTSFPQAETQTSW